MNILKLAVKRRQLQKRREMGWDGEKAGLLDMNCDYGRCYQSFVFPLLYAGPGVKAISGIEANLA